MMEADAVVSSYGHAAALVALLALAGWVGYRWTEISRVFRGWWAARAARREWEREWERDLRQIRREYEVRRGFLARGHFAHVKAGQPREAACPVCRSKTQAAAR